MAMKNNVITKVAMSALLLCGGMQLACAVPMLLGTATWTSGTVTHEYRLYADPEITWNDASAWVSSKLDGFYLATITDAAEQSFINGSVFASRVGEYWLGGHQNPIDTLEPTANWTWVTGEPWSYTNWACCEPNDNYGPGSEQYLGGNWTDAKMWNDEGNLSVIVGFLAERTIPEPATMLLFGIGLAALAVGSVGRKNRYAGKRGAGWRSTSRARAQ
jgi:hypothetical protein